MNITWTDELDPRQLRKLDMVSVNYCDGEWNCCNEINHAIEIPMAFDLFRWVFFCDQHLESGEA